MKRVPIARVLLIIFFAGLLLTPLVVKRLSSERKASAKTTLDTSAALARHGFYLQEVSRDAGIDFVHQGPAQATEAPRRGRGRPKFEGVRPWEAEGISRAEYFRRKKGGGGG